MSKQDGLTVLTCTILSTHRSRVNGPPFAPRRVPERSRFCPTRPLVFFLEDAPVIVPPETRPAASIGDTFRRLGFVVQLTAK